MRLPLRPCLLLALVGAGCASAPPRPPPPPPTLGTVQLHLGAQDLASATLQLTADVTAAQDARVHAARWELVLDGQVVGSGQTPLGQPVAAGQTTTLSFPVQVTLARSAAELRALTERGGSLLVALRGELHTQVGGFAHPLPFAASRELRVPRLPAVSLARVDAARYSTGEVRLQLGLGVSNPNAFPLLVESLAYQVTVGGRPAGEGSRAHHDTLRPATLSLYELDVEASAATHGEALARPGALPYRVEGEVRGALFRVPFVLEGAAQLAPAR